MGIQSEAPMTYYPTPDDLRAWAERDEREAEAIEAGRVRVDGLP